MSKGQIDSKIPILLFVNRNSIAVIRASIELSERQIRFLRKILL